MYQVLLPQYTPLWQLWLEEKSPSHPDHKYIWLRGGGSQPLKSLLQVGGGV